MSLFPAGFITAGAEDCHVHSSTYSDDARSPLPVVVEAARRNGLTTLCMAEHVRMSTPWVADYVAQLHDLRADDIRLVASVEAKLLDADGRLDLPDCLDLVDAVHVADHQFPLDGPTHPDEVRRLLASGELTAADALTTLIDATSRALMTVPNPVLAHLFSILPKVGLDESQIPLSALRGLASAATNADATLEVNAKWQCPSPRTIAVFVAAGVPVVASTDAHHADEVGRWGLSAHVAAAVDSVGVA